MELDENHNTTMTVAQPPESTPVLDEPLISPKPQLSMTLADPDESINGNTDTDINALGASLKPVVDARLHSLDGTKRVVDTGVELDISRLGPNGLNLDDTDLTHIDPSDGIVDGSLLNHPFIQGAP